MKLMRFWTLWLEVLSHMCHSPVEHEPGVCPEELVAFLRAFLPGVLENHKS